MSETKETLLNNIADRVAKFMFASEEKSEAKEVKLEVAKLEDGTEVEIEGDDISVLVKQEGEEVEKIPAPVGEHTLENGDVVIVREEGKIAEVKSGEEEVEAKDEKEMDLASEVESLKKEMAELKEKVEAGYSEKEEMSKEEAPKEEPKKEELSKEEPKEEVKEEVQLSEEAPKKVTHSPEKQVKPKFNVKLKNHGGTKSRVYSKLFS